ncbi:MAG: alanine--tRNA ligase [Monoglobus pectinilyticus]|uniref:alanine--tRNA ligase n=1 Tax=Monoglobus pectinilyticus TaxID=1981510 RepID=UPI00300ECEA2
MQKLGLNEIREKFLSFFESKGHLRLPSFPLVPQNDSSLLLINAGMAPLKPYFTGKEVPPAKRVTTCQKCIRTPDIEQVGQTARHGTFFEMLGNFSFGDYFKMDATKWAWEFATEVLEMPKDRIWVSVYNDDYEAADIWTNHVGVSKDRIVYLGKDDNFWEIGTGPCGPCSELYYDRGEEYGCGSPDCAVGCDCDRFVEFWNLVFTQFDKDENGTYNKLDHPNIDTGMGLERIACIMQGTTSIFEVDTIRKVLNAAAEIAGVKYGEDNQIDTSLRVITDHIRSTVFMTADGVLPSNEGRGYVLRRLLRRAARHGKMLGINEMFLYKLARVVADESMTAYPELDQNFAYIESVIKSEEARFDETIDQGILILNQYMEEMKQSGTKELDGEKAFKLYDTYGFPIDLTKEIMGENGFVVATKLFDDLLNEQRIKSKVARGNMDDAAWENDIFIDVEGSTVFDGYAKLKGTSNVLAIAKGSERVEEAEAGEEVTLVLDIFTFYAESGGQVGDTGIIESDDASLKVIDTKKSNGKFLHICKVENGVVKVGDKVTTLVDKERRQSIKRNHSAVHLVQAALREVLGKHVAQAGSYVDEYRFRFDFSHYQPLTEDEILKVGMLVNKKIMEAIPVECFEEDVATAKSMGAMALFSEKYGSRVRVVKMGDFSTELCGGCHVENTGKLGLMKILSETGVSAGVRRIEGVTGYNVILQMREKSKLIDDVSSVLKTNPSDLLNRAEGIVAELKDARHEIDSLKSKLAKNSVDDILGNTEDIGGVKVVTKILDDNIDMNTMREIGDNIKNKIPNAFVVLASKIGEKVNLISMASKEAIDKGANAGAVISEIAKQLGGGGGGKPDSAQAGGKKPEKTEEVMKNVSDILKKHQEKNK